MGELKTQLNMTFKSGDFFAVDKLGNSLHPEDIILINNKFYKLLDAEYFYDYGIERVVIICKSADGKIWRFIDASVERH